MERVILCVGCCDTVVEFLDLLFGYFVFAFPRRFLHHQLVHWICLIVVGQVGGVCFVFGFCFLLWVKKKSR